MLAELGMQQVQSQFSIISDERDLGTTMDG